MKSRKGKLTKIQLELDERENKILELHKLICGFKTKQEALKDLIRFAEDSVKEAIKCDKDIFSEGLR